MDKEEDVMWYILRHGKFSFGRYDKKPDGHRYVSFYRSEYGLEVLNSLWIFDCCIEYHY